jgi:hypothetical protein
VRESVVAKRFLRTGDYLVYASATGFAADISAPELDSSTPMTDGGDGVSQCGLLPGLRRVESDGEVSS